MIYLPIKEARKYIKRETGIKFSDYEVSRLVESRLVRGAVDTADLREMGVYWGYKIDSISHFLELVPDNIVDKVADELSFGICGCSNGYANITISDEERRNMFGMYYMINITCALSKVRHFLMSNDSELASWAYQNLLVDGCNVKSDGVPTWWSWEAIEFYNKKLSPLARKLAVVDLYTYEEEKGWMLIQEEPLIIGISMVHIALSDIRHLVTLINKGDFGNWGSLTEARTQPKTSKNPKMQLVAQKATSRNRELLISLMLSAVKDYKLVLELAGKEMGSTISEANIIGYIETNYPELKGRGVAGRQLEKIFAGVKKQRP